MGSVSKTTHITAIIPQEFFTSIILAVTVRNASLIVEPTMGIKLPMANLAVLIERESAL